MALLRHLRFRQRLGFRSLWRHAMDRRQDDVIGLVFGQVLEKLEDVPCRLLPALLERPAGVTDQRAIDPAPIYTTGFASPSVALLNPDRLWTATRISEKFATSSHSQRSSSVTSG